MVTAAVCGLAAIGACAPAWAWGTHAGGGQIPSAMTQEGATPLQIDAGVMASNVESRVNPIYPPEAKAAGVQGSVVLDATIGVDGSLTALKLVSGTPELAKAAWVAVSHWTWRPYVLNGVPTAVQTTITVNFSLNP